MNQPSWLFTSYCWTRTRRRASLIPKAMQVSVHCDSYIRCLKAVQGLQSAEGTRKTTRSASFFGRKKDMQRSGSVGVHSVAINQHLSPILAQQEKWWLSNCVTRRSVVLVTAAEAWTLIKASIQIQKTLKPPGNSPPISCMYKKRCVLSQSCDALVSAHSRASLWFHARQPFVSIIIARLKDGDLLGLMETVMPLCPGIKNRFTTCTFVMSLYYRTRDIRREIVPCTSIKLNFKHYQREEWKFDWWPCLRSC